MCPESQGYNYTGEHPGIVAVTKSGKRHFRFENPILFRPELTLSRDKVTSE